MKQENKKSKKKILLYYLILAACLLVIAAVTVTVIFTVNRNKTPISAGTDIENPDDNKGNEDDNKGNQGDNNDNNPGKPDDGKEDNKPTTNVKGYVLPMRTATVTNTYDFIYDVTLDRYCVHQGMDFEGKTGDEVCAVLDGTVTQIVKDHILDGSYITLTHAGGVTTTYKFIEASDNLQVGSTVKQGDVIGVIAAANGSEMKQGEHLHFEMKVNGKQANPNDYLDIIEK